MSIALLENTMYEVSNTFLLPVLLVIVSLFFYGFYMLGRFVAQYRQRKQGQNTMKRLAQGEGLEPIKGYPLISDAAHNPQRKLRDHEIRALKLLEPARMVTRIAPMLGLVATMIPMGPALKALANGNVQGISENLIVAFTAVIFGLITASITFWIASVRKQWMLDELRIIEDDQERRNAPDGTGGTDKENKPAADGMEKMDKEARYATA